MQRSYSIQARNPEFPRFTSELRDANAWFVQMYKNLTQWLTLKEEMTIKKIDDGDGYIWWEVYDPHTRQYKWTASELEAMRWADQYHHRVRSNGCKHYDGLSMGQDTYFQEANPLTYMRH